MRSLRKWHHVQDIIGVIEYEDLRDVILVGHSYGGYTLPHAMTSMLPLQPYTSHHGIAPCASMLLSAWMFCRPRSVSRPSRAAIPLFIRLEWRPARLHGHTQLQNTSDRKTPRLNSSHVR